jgi:hypothetical protein
LHVSNLVEGDRFGRDCDGRWWPITKSGVRSFRVVVATPLFNDHLGFLEAVEDLAIKQFAPKIPVEGFTVAILPWRPRFNVQVVGTKRGQSAGNEVVRGLSNLSAGS